MASLLLIDWRVLFHRKPLRFKWLNFFVAFFDKSSAVACAIITHARTHTKEPWGWSLLFIASDNIRKQKLLHISCRSFLFFNYLRSRQNIFISPRPIRVAFVTFFFLYPFFGPTFFKMQHLLLSYMQKKQRYMWWCV